MGDNLMAEKQTFSEVLNEHAQRMRAAFLKRGLKLRTDEEMRVEIARLDALSRQAQQ